MKLPFELDPEIIHHIIYSQAGSIGKAVIELIMNSIDAGATAVRLSLDKSGFVCRDDGKGFASRDDVVRYFGRFGTPHVEGDATYGRFRLGRGQIMAHASTHWKSNAWSMEVDTRTMGYSYELTDLAVPVSGCDIAGRWYEPLAEAELQSCLQEIRDLVRYTPVSVELNGRLITRDPAQERWDHVDAMAYYRVKDEGAVSIYNQGVLVRHDPAGAWGAGGVIVSKQAIGLNVSRTEILRKTCPVWQPIAKQFKALADELAATLGAHRKTEARREQCAKALLSGDPRSWKLFEDEEVITVLPGKRHITLRKALQIARGARGNMTVVELPTDVPRGEVIAQQGIALVVHDKTLERFGCASPSDFQETLERVFEHLRRIAAEQPEGHCHNWIVRRLEKELRMPQLVAFKVLKDAFVVRTKIVREAELGVEARRAWRALRWCLVQYAGACLGHKVMARSWRLHWDVERMAVILGESNQAEAWTDGRSYIAIHVKHAKALLTAPLLTANYIFNLVEHEIAHEGDSLDCGHDEVFYQRFHDLSMRMAPMRQKYLHIWLMKYTQSLEREGKKARGEAWFERMLVDRAGNGRLKRGMGPVMDDLAAHPLVVAEVPDEDTALLDRLNVALVEAGQCPPPPDWGAILTRARAAQEQLDHEAAQEREQRRAYEVGLDAEIERIAAELGLSAHQVGPVVSRLWGLQGDELRSTWQGVLDEEAAYEEAVRDEEAAYEAMQAEWEQEVQGLGDGDDMAPSGTSSEEAPGPDQVWLNGLAPELRALIEPGETRWSLERNAAAAGFAWIEGYLRWRAAEAA